MEQNSDGNQRLIPKEPVIIFGDSMKDGNQTLDVCDQKLEKVSKKETSSDDECREDKTTSSSGLKVLSMVPWLALASSQVQDKFKSHFGTVLVVGKTGAGKSSLINLMTGPHGKDGFATSTSSQVQDKFKLHFGTVLVSGKTVAEKSSLINLRTGPHGKDGFATSTSVYDDFDFLENKEIQFFEEEDIQEEMDQRINSVWNYKVVTRMDQQEDKPTSLYDLWHEVKSSSDERRINKTEALSEYLIQILLQGLLVLLARGTTTKFPSSTISGGACPAIFAMESLQRLCILKGIQNFLTNNSFPTRSSMRNDSMRNKDPQFHQTQTPTPQRDWVKKMLNEDNQKYEMENRYKVAFLL